MTKPYYCNFTCRDNAGIKKCYSVNFTRLDNNFGRILASLTSVVVAKKFKRGDLLQLIIFGTRQKTSRSSGIVSSLNYNGAIALKKDGSPLGTRVYGPIFLEARYSGYLRLAVISRGII